MCVCGAKKSVPYPESLGGRWVRKNKASTAGRHLSFAYVSLVLRPPPKPALTFLNNEMEAVDSLKSSLDRSDLWGTVPRGTQD